jgi:hypothetical protein
MTPAGAIEEPNCVIILRSNIEHLKPGDHVQWKNLSGACIDDLLIGLLLETLQRSAKYAAHRKAPKGRL